MYKKNNKPNSRKIKVLNLNLSATMIVAVIIVFVIIAIVAVKMIATAINSRSQRAMAEEETLNNENAKIATMSEEENGGIATLAEGETPTTGSYVVATTTIRVATQQETATTTIRPTTTATMVVAPHSNIIPDYAFYGMYTVKY